MYARWGRQEAAALSIAALVLACRSSAATGPAIRYRLENGLSVVLLPEPARADVAVMMQYHVGTLDEPKGYDGIAHLVEHLTYRGSRHLAPTEAFTGLERAGATEINGFTGQSDTIYRALVPAAALETALWIESERMAFTLERFSDANLNAEREIVRTEMALRLGVGSSIPAFARQAFYPAGHPLRPHERNLRDLDAIRLPHVQWFYQKWYRPDDATLILAGHFSPASAKSLIERYFGPIVAPHEALPIRDAKEPSLPVVRKLHASAPVLYESFLFSWPLSNSARDAAVARMAAILLDSVLDKELGKEVRDVRVGFDEEGPRSSFDIHVTLDPVARLPPDLVAQTVASAVARLSRQPPARSNVDEARARSMAQVAAEESGPFDRGMSLLEGQPPSEDVRQALQTETPESFSANLRSVLPLDRRVVVFVSSSSTAPYQGEIVDEWEGK